MPPDSKGRDLFIVDNSVSGWTGLRFLAEWTGIAKAPAEGSWRHTKITLKSSNPEFEPIELAAEDEDRIQVIAEFLEVLQ